MDNETKKEIIEYCFKLKRMFSSTAKNMKKEEYEPSKHQVEGAIRTIDTMIEQLTEFKNNLSNIYTDGT